MSRSLGSIVLLLTIPLFAVNAVHADEETNRRIAELERRVDKLPASIQQHGSDGAALFLYGAFCALSAQNTGRNAWLWFFLGLFCNVFAVIALLVKNSEDRSKRYGRQMETT